MLTSILLFMGIGTPELLVILFAILLLFGGNKLPELARGLGKGIREFKDASDGVKREFHRNIDAIGNDLDIEGNDKKPNSVNSSAQANATASEIDESGRYAGNHAYNEEAPTVKEPVVGDVQEQTKINS